MEIFLLLNLPLKQGHSPDDNKGSDTKMYAH